MNLDRGQIKEGGVFVEQFFPNQNRRLPRSEFRTGFPDSGPPQAGGASPLWARLFAPQRDEGADDLR